jgi:MFS family permease
LTTTPDSANGGTASRWLVLTLLALGVMIAFLDRTSVSSALLAPSFTKQFALSGVGRGWLNSAFFWSYGLMQIPMGWVVDRYGSKWPYAICFLLWCVATALTGIANSLSVLILVRVLVGAAESIVMPASYRWIKEHFTETQNGTAVGIFAMGNKLGPAIGAPVAAWLIVRYDWRLMFILTGIVGIAWLVPWLTLVRSDIPKADALAARRGAAAVSLRTILASPVVWGAMISNFCYGYFTFFCMTWMPVYLVDARGLSLQQSGLYTFYSFAGIAIVALAAGWAADRIIARGGDPVFVRKAFIVTGFIGACTVMLSARANSVPAALFWNVFSLSFLGLVTANNLALARLTLIPRAAIGLTTGVQQLATSLAGGVAASLTGWLVQVGGGYTLPMLAIIVFLIIGAVSTIVLLQPKWSPKVPAPAPPLHPVAS